MRAAGLATLLVACSAETVMRPAPPPVDWASLEPPPSVVDAGVPTATSKERQAADAYARALASRGFDAIANILDENAHFSFAGFKDVRGRNSIVHVHRALLGMLTARTFQVDRTYVTDRSQVVEWTMNAVHDAKPVTLQGLTILWTQDDGAIRDVHLYFDEALLRAQLGDAPKGMGAVPAPEPRGPRQDFEGSRRPEESANVAVVRDALEAFENRDEARYVGALADDVELTTLEAVRPIRGKAAARAYFATMHRAIAQLDATVDNVWGVGAFVVVEYHVVGEQRAPFQWVPAQKDNLVKMYVVDVLELRAGKIARIRRYDNPSQLLVTPHGDRP